MVVLVRENKVGRFFSREGQGFCDLSVPDLCPVLHLVDETLHLRKKWRICLMKHETGFQDGKCRWQAAC